MRWLNLFLNSNTKLKNIRTISRFHDLNIKLIIDVKLKLKFNYPSQFKDKKKKQLKNLLKDTEIENSRKLKNPKTTVRRQSKN